MVEPRYSDENSLARTLGLKGGCADLRRLDVNERYNRVVTRTKVRAERMNAHGISSFSGNS